MEGRKEDVIDYTWISKTGLRKKIIEGAFSAFQTQDNCAINHLGSGFKLARDGVRLRQAVPVHSIRSTVHQSCLSHCSDKLSR